ncbi:MAG: glycosyltransferase family 9 protein [Spirochaetota bacterium]
MMTVSVFNTERIGDSMLALPAMRSFLAHYPGARSILVTDTSTAPLYSASGMFSAVHHFRYRKASVPDMLRAAKVLSAEHIDVMMLMPGGFFAAFIAFFAHARVRVGLASDMRGFLLTHRVRPRIDDRHRMHHFLDLLAPLGIPASELTPHINVPAGDILPRSPVPTIGIAPFTRDDPRRMYPLARWRALIASIAGQKERIIIAGSKDEAVHYRAFLDEMVSAYGVVDAVGKYSLLDTARLLTQCDVVIANDSGLMHLAAAAGTPTVALFGATRSEKAGPLGDHTRVVASPSPCRPCDAKARCTDVRCMDAIETHDVLAAMNELLERRDAVPNLSRKRNATTENTEK